MASPDTTSKVFALVYTAFPSRKPNVSTPDKAAEFGLTLNLWSESYRDVPDQRLMAAAARFVRETSKLYPDDNPFAMILAMATPPNELAQTTAGDCMGLIDEAVSRFGMYRDDEAVKWIREKSELAAAAVERVGFRNYCASETPDVVRGQLRMVFETEKKRAVEIGHVVTSDQLKRDGITQAVLAGPNLTSNPPRSCLRLRSPASQGKIPAARLHPV